MAKSNLRVLNLTEQELLIDVFPLDNLEGDETGQKGDDLVSRNVGMADDEIEGDMFVLQNVEDCSDGIGIGHYGTLGFLRLAPHGQMNRRGNDVLVGNTDIGSPTSVFTEDADGTTIRRRDCGNDDGPFFYMIGVEFDAGLRPAIAVGSLMHHVYLFLGTYAGEVAVVAHPNE